MSTRYDALVIGAGHNGLTCGAYLARAGLRTCVLEGRPVIGGAAVSEEIIPGFTATTFSYLLAHFHPKIISDLELKRWLHVTPVNECISPVYDDDYFWGSSDISVMQRSISRFSKHDASEYPAFLRELDEIGHFVRQILVQIPFDPTRRDWRTFKETASLLWKNRRLRKHSYRIIDLISLSSNEFLSNWFESDVLKGYLSFAASCGNFVGPSTPGSALALLYHVLSQQEEALKGHPRGGMGSVSKAIAASGAEHGMDVKIGDPVAGVIVRDARVSGVVTRSGQEYSAAIVVSNVHPKVLFNSLLGDHQLDEAFLREVNAIKTFSTAWKINIACESPLLYKTLRPNEVGVDRAVFGHIAPDVQYLDRAYLDALNGWYSAKPFVSALAPSLIDPSLAPKGKHVVSLFGGHAPYELKDGRWECERDRFVKSVMDVVDDAAPGFSSGIIEMQVLTPRDIEAVLNLPQGHILHGEMSLDQMFFSRPVPRYADYRTPVSGLYQCGSACHPGGGVTGMPGYNAARVVMGDSRSKRRPRAGHSEPTTA